MNHTKGPWNVFARYHVYAICCEPTRKGEHPEVCFIEVVGTCDDLSAGSITATLA